MSLDSYGGNPDIVATRVEIERISLELKAAALVLQDPQSLIAIFEDPLRLIHFKYRSSHVISKIEELYQKCHLVADSYFSTEAQINKRFEVTIVPEIAGMLLWAGSSWRFEQRILARLSKSKTQFPPNTITAMLDRLWKLSNQDQPTVGIELYGEEDSRVAVVYIPGTQSVGFGTDSNPLDMQSNLLAMSGSSKAASEQAVLLAMGQAGISASDEVIFVGHSQGGMVAGNLVASEQFKVAGLIAIGAPIAQLAIKKSLVLAIEHSNDPVPNLSGKINPLQSNWLTVQRKALAEESDAILSSHSLKSYKNTTKAIDESNDKTIKTFRERIASKLRNQISGVSKEFVISQTK